MQSALSSTLATGSRATVDEARVNNLIITLLSIRLAYGGLAALTLRSAPTVAGGLGLLYILGTYLVTAILIWRTRTCLSECRVSKLALILFLVSSPYRLFLALSKLLPLNPFPILPLIPVALWLGVSLIRDRQVHATNPPTLLRWLGAGVVAGILFGAMAGFLISLQGDQGTRADSALKVILYPTIQISSAAVQEEPLFRGFL
jgi:hypothetical protein